MAAGERTDHVDTSPDVEMDLGRLRWELNNLLQRNKEEKQNLASAIDNLNAAIQAAQRDIHRVTSNYKDFLEQNESLLNSAVKTLAKYPSSLDSTAGAQPRSLILPYPQEHESSTFDSSEVGIEICEASDSKNYKYQVELLDVEHNADEGVRRCFYKPQKSPPSTPKTKLRPFKSVTSLLNQPSLVAQDAHEMRVRRIGEYRDQDDVSEKQFKLEFKYPYQLANGPKDELIVTDRECHQLIIFDANLQPLSVFGKRGPGEGTFYNPTGLAVDTVGSYLYVADHNNIIQKFKIAYDEGTPSCKLQYVDQYGRKGRKPGELQCPCGLALSKSGSRLYVCDFRNHRIQVFNTNNRDTLHVFGKHGKGHGEFDEPHSITMNSNEDKLFVSDHSNNRIQVFTPQGEFCQVIVDYTTSPNQQMQYPRGIYYTHEGQLLVSCTFTHCILEFEDSDDVDSIIYKSTVEGIVQPGGIVKRHDGKVVVTSNVKQILVVFELQ